MHIELSETGDPADRAAILAPLRAYNLLATGRAAKPASIAVLLRDAQGEVEGGMFGHVGWDWFKLEFAFLPAHRRRHRLGARMLSSLETRAVALGAKGAWMNSFSFQAPGFYEKLGYTEIGRIADRPPGHYDALLAKTAGFGREGCELVVTDDPTEAERQAVMDGLRDYSDAVVGPSNRSQLALVARDADGAVMGGLWGRIGRGWLFVDLLGLEPQARGAGLGTRLMAMAEAQARAKGCIGIWLDTFSFQARPFYEGLGFAVFAELADYPAGHTRYFLQKRLDR